VFRVFSLTPLGGHHIKMSIPPPKELDICMENFRICLSETELPQEWYNIQPDLPRPFPPYLHPATGQPLGPQDLAPIFPWGSSSRR
jgi:hypothetical protein